MTEVEPSRPVPPSASPRTPEGAGPAAGETPVASAFDIGLRPLGLLDPLRWLVAGWRDFMRCPAIGLFYGACFALMGWALITVYQQAPAYVLALSAGFLLVGPLLCLGLYHASRQLEAGLRPDLGESLLAWDRKLATLAIFGFVLLVLEMLWGRASLIVFAVSFDGMPDFKGSLMALLDPENLQFIVAYLLVGAVFAGLIFAISVISIPMILDQQTDAITAGLTSLRLVLTQPLVMLLWGALITGLIVLAMLPWFAGLLLAGPVLGHASWHAYRSAVVAPRDEA
ncbi:DUF2189 domain-containing protein [Aquabacterium sp. OR-4]|uniref:DUF2189 domain-containing protein n=1 Tax=Aquabacterium sp. OR-4 TaxID=2978127 RepID=UPI0021B1B307|nr:DUF2189 domain-containing protein [Aquabacterium sp. OR-4]MDT7835687.1 DUF2189 domain-containing protein [Aquabacterium sp. OR-4]